MEDGRRNGADAEAPANAPSLSQPNAPVMNVDGVELPADGPAPQALEAAEQPLEDALGFFDVKDAAEGKTPQEERPSSASPASEAPAADGPQGQAQPKRVKPKGLRIGVAGASHRAPKRSQASGAPVAKVKKTSGPRTRVGEEESRDKAKARKGALFMVAVLGAYIVWIVLSGQFDEFVGALHNADGAWFVAGLLVMSLNFFFGSLAFVLAAYIDPDSPLGLRDCISVEANGVLFGNLTPMSTGTMPAQIFRLTQAGLDVGDASATQLTRFVIYQAGEVVVAAALLLLRFDFFLATYGNIVFLNIVVFIVQTLQAGGLLVVCLFPRFVSRVGHWALSLASRRDWLSRDKVERYEDVLQTQVMSFGGTFRDSFRHKESLAFTLLVTLGQMLAFYAVPWFVLRAFGGDADFVTCLAAASMVQMIGNSVPLPGGTGGNEAGFALFFGPIFGSTAAAGFIVWRIITFFIPTLAALPLCALRSSHRRSIYQRWQHFRTRRGRRAAYVSVSKRNRRR
ncbi:lysylphosphatidylglycerol synthase transmembrane domain-containing protein [Atopobiaceae bacterium 24-176]